VLLLIGAVSAPITSAHGATSSVESHDTSIDYTIFRLASEKNDASAQYLVGRNYLKGKSVAKDVKKALRWFERAAEQGHARAQYQLGKMYLYGENVKQDLNLSYYYLIQAAGQHDLDAQFELANYYLQGTPDTKQYTNAITWLRRAVKREHVRAHYELGKLVYEGKGTPANPTEAVTLLSIASENGLLEASRYLEKIKKDNPQLAISATNAKVTKPPSPEMPIAEKSASTAKSNQDPVTTSQVKAEPDADKYYRMGLDALTNEKNSRDLDKAAMYFQKAADKNHGKAQYQLAKLYQQGIGVEQDDSLYRKWLEKSASSGVQSAQRDLQTLNNKSKTTSKSKTLSKEHSKAPSKTPPKAPAATLSSIASKPPAAPTPRQSVPMMVLVDKEKEKASPSDLYIRGLKYLTGNDVEKDPVRASKLFQEAASLNHPRSQYQLGLMYIDGIGVKRDSRQAQRWLSKAAGAGVADARDVLTSLFPEQTTKTTSDTLAITIDSIKKQPEPEIALSINSDSTNAKSNSTMPNNALQKSSNTSKKPTLSNLEIQANDNDPAAQYTLGLYYLNGHDSYEKNTERAIQWLTKAADNNFTQAQIELGNVYIDGTHVERDYEQAARWFDRAAQSDDPEAQYLLGRLFQKGLGVTKDKSIAIMWYRKAANQGHREARKRLGGCRIC